MRLHWYCKWFWFEWSDYSEDFRTRSFWKGFRCGWGTPRGEGERYRHEFTIVVDVITWKYLVDTGQV